VASAFDQFWTNVPFCPKKSVAERWETPHLRWIAERKRQMAKPDRRTERTRVALMTAFIDLVLTKGYEAVTVEQVAARANVGRSTFYMHFSGKDDILKKSMARVSMALALIVGHDIAPDMVVQMLEHYRAQRTRNRVFFTDPVRQLWVKCLAELIEPRLTKVARIARSRPVLPLPLIALQLAEGQISLIVNWLLGKAPAKPESVAEALIVSTRAGLAALLRCDPAAHLFIPGETLRVIVQPDTP
jgi:AcrR family transcriptional regulator